MDSAETFESPGKYLKAKRESQKLSLKEVADTTRIREPVLRALEEDRYANLPALYVKSFLSSYAECIGLDSNEVIMAYQNIAEKLSFSKDRVLTPHPPSGERGLLFGCWSFRCLFFSWWPSLYMPPLNYCAKFSSFLDRRNWPSLSSVPSSSFATVLSIFPGPFTMYRPYSRR